MPKQIWKIDQFHGGLNNNSDPRDIAPNELSAATDVMVDEIGKIRPMGGTAAHGEVPSNTTSINPGYGLFQFSHDRLGASTTSASQYETGDDYLAMADATTGDVDIYSLANDAWVTGVVTLGPTAGMKAVFYIADGVLRVLDGNFSTTNEAMWYGYIDRYFFGDGINGLTSSGYTNGARLNKWVQEKASIKAVPLAHVRGNDAPDPSPSPGAQYPTHPLMIGLQPKSNLEQNVASSGTISSGCDSINCVVTFSGSSPHVTAITNTTPGYSTFCSAGDKILVMNSASDDNNRIFTVSSVASDATDPNTIDFEEAPTYGSSDTIQMYNLSKSEFFDPANQGLEFAVSTLLDDSKQESALYVFRRTGTHAGGSSESDTKTNTDGGFGGTDDYKGWRINNLRSGGTGIIKDMSDAGVVVTRAHMAGGTGTQSWVAGDEWEIKTMYPQAIVKEDTGVTKGLGQIGITFYAGCATSASAGLIGGFPRTSGFRIYMRREDTTTWYLQSEVDVTRGHKLPGSVDWNMWDENTALPAVCTIARSGFYSSLREVETYGSMTGYSADIDSVGFDGIGSGAKSVVVANRVAYAGHPRIRDRKGDLHTYGDTILKSDIGKFDSFGFDRRLETEISDGDEIVKLESYADRLLIFKKTKMQLLNISQEIEFLEETLMYKGISHPSAVCKTDFGIAWVNKQGVYLYDGRQVSNLLEKGGRQIIKESEWATFTTNEPMIGYVPKKRQLIVVDVVTSNGTGSIHLYDMVTQSWVKGGAASLDDQLKTNFVIDWNGDLVYAHSGTGTPVKWSDGSVNQAVIDITTNDIDFGQPGQRKKVYKVYVTYKSDGTPTTIKYDTNGDTGLDKTFNESFGSSATEWTTASFTPSTSSECTNINSIRLRIFSSGSTTTSTFEINDISIVYRLKPVK